MANGLPNQYSLSNLPNIDPQVRRVMQDLTDRINFLTGEVERLKERDLVIVPSGVARKESPVEGIIQIPYRNDGGQDGQVRVSKDGVIVSYVNPAESIFPYIDLTTVNSVGVGPDTLHTFLLPANSLAVDGDFLDVWYSGSHATNDRNKATQALFDGLGYEGAAPIDLDSGPGWTISSRIMRVSPTSVRTSHIYVANDIHADSAGAVTTFGAGGFIVTRNSTFTVSNLSSTNIVMSVTSTVEAGAAAADVYQNKSIIQLYRPRTRKLV